MFINVFKINILMKGVGYSSNVIFSIKMLISNPKLFIPDVIRIIIYFFITILLVYINNFWQIVYTDKKLLFDTLHSLIDTAPQLIKLIVSLAIALFFAVWVGIGAISMRYNMIKQILSEGKISAKKAYFESKKYNKRIFLVKAISFIIYLVPLTLISGIGLGILKNQGIQFKGFLILFISLSFLLVLNLAFIFVYPILILGRNKTFMALKLSINYFRKNIKKCFVTLVITAIASWLFNFFIYPLLTNFVNYSDANLWPNNLILLFISSWFIHSMIKLPIELWTDVFVFKSY